MTSQFPDNVISKAEEEIAHHDNKHYSGGSQKILTSNIFTVSQASTIRDLDHQPGKHLALMVTTDEVEAKLLTTPSEQIRGKVFINDNYCAPKKGFVEMAGRIETFVDNCQTLNVNYLCVNHVPSVAMQQPQKKG